MSTPAYRPPPFDSLYGVDLLRFLGRWVENPDDVKDLAQEVYGKFYEASKKGLLRGRNPKAYLIGIARNVRADHLEKAAKQLVTADSTLAESAADRDVYTWSNPPEAAEAARQQFDRALDTLPPSVRKVMELAFDGSLSNKEIAEKLGLTESTVEKYRQIGASFLQDSLKEI